MAHFHLTEERLLARIDGIREILNPLVKSPQRFHCGFVRSKTQGERVIAAHEGDWQGKDYRDLLFYTPAKNLRGRYFEIWTETETGKAWTMERAYLHLVEVDAINRRYVELICVHCDPADKDRFKQGPHLHVEALKSPLHPESSK